MEEEEIAKRPSLASVTWGRSTKQGTLRKKNSIYFKKGFQLDFKENQDLRKTVTQKLKNAAFDRNNSIFSNASRNNSMFKTGTLEHRLTSMMDMAHLEFQEHGPDEEEYIRQVEKHNQDKEYYDTLKEDQAFGKYHDKCKAKAKRDLENFYKEAEKELFEIEKLLGVDEEGLKRIGEQVKDHESRANKEKVESKAKVSKEEEGKEGVKKEV